MNIQISTKQIIILCTFFVIVVFSAIGFWFATSKLYVFNKKEVVTDTVQIPYEKVNEKDENILKGATALKQEGEYGIKEIKTELTYDDKGDILRKRKVGEKIVKAPRNEITVEGIGTVEEMRVTVSTVAQKYLQGWKDKKWNIIISNSWNLS